VYLSPVIDCFDGLVVSCSKGTRPDAELVNTMLDSAIDQWPAAGSGLSFTRIVVRTIAGQDGCRECRMPD
jgi:transposase InsO family protein